MRWVHRRTPRLNSLAALSGDDKPVYPSQLFQGERRGNRGVPNVVARVVRHAQARSVEEALETTKFVSHVPPMKMQMKMLADNSRSVTAAAG